MQSYSRNPQSVVQRADAALKAVETQCKNLNQNKNFQLTATRNLISRANEGKATESDASAALSELNRTGGYQQSSRSAINDFAKN